MIVDVALFMIDKFYIRLFDAMKSCFVARSRIFLFINIWLFRYFSVSLPPIFTSGVFFQILINMDNKQEIFPLVDEEGAVIGSATRGECHSGSKLLHPVVHLHVFNSQGQVYLQRRPDWKDIQPGKWDTAVGGHIDYGENPTDALRREVREELGITDFTPRSLGKYVFESKKERELVYVNTTIYDGVISPSTEELAGGRFWTIDEIRAALGKDVLTPNFESEFTRFFLNN